jgi:hypothetical protein
LQPKAVTETDDDALAKLMADAERANAQVSGDDDSEADDE